MKKNSIEVIDDIITYGTRYGYEALGLALADMIKNNEIHITNDNVNSLWEYGGNTNL